MNILLIFFILFDMITSCFVMDKYFKIKQKIKIKEEEIEILNIIIDFLKGSKQQ